MWVRWRWRQLQRRRERAAHCAINTPLANVLNAPLPSPTERLRRSRLIAIDLETTGLDANQDEIVSIGWITLENGRINTNSSRHIIVKPDQGVGDSAIIHGIRDCDRADGATLAQAMTALFNDLPNAIPVFHHALLDMAFLEKACRGLWQCPWPSLYLDTLAWHRQRQLKRGAHHIADKAHLNAVLQYHGIPLRNAHNALDDALSCAEVALALIAKGKGTLGETAMIWA